LFDPAMTAVDFLGHRIGGQHLERVLDLFPQMALVFFDSQNIVGLFADDLLSDGSLAANGIDG